jgi:hypothetical protein
MCGQSLPVQNLHELLQGILAPLVCYFLKNRGQTKPPLNFISVFIFWIQMDDIQNFIYIWKNRIGFYSVDSSPYKIWKVRGKINYRIHTRYLKVHPDYSCMAWDSCCRDSRVSAAKHLQTATPTLQQTLQPMAPVDPTARAHETIHIYGGTRDGKQVHKLKSKYSGHTVMKLT